MRYEEIVEAASDVADTMPYTIGSNFGGEEPVIRVEERSSDDGDEHDITVGRKLN